MKRKIKYIWLLYIGIVFFAASCQSVKPYQKAKLNDEEMSLSPRDIEVFETNFETYREGAAGANGGKSGGGCGCY